MTSTTYFTNRRRQSNVLQYGFISFCRKAYVLRGGHVTSDKKGGKVVNLKLLALLSAWRTRGELILELRRFTN